MIFDLVEFNKTPPNMCREVDGVSWDRIRDGWKNKLMSTMFDEPGEEWHANNAHKTYLPDTDPLFSFSSIIHSVPVPWQRTNQDATSARSTGLKIKSVRKTQPENFHAEISFIPLNSSANTNVIVGDVIIKVNGVTVASNDGTLLRSDGNELDAIVAAMKQCSEGHIVEMDVLREYRKVRSVSPTIASVSTTELDYGNVNDSNIHATEDYDVSRMRSDGVAPGVKTTGLYDSDHETGDAVMEESFNNDGDNESVGY
jgi:hypothetical protein